MDEISVKEFLAWLRAERTSSVIFGDVAYYLAKLQEHKKENSGG